VIMGIRSFFPALLGVFFVVAGCSQNAGPPVEIRPGLTSQADLDAIRPPTGVSYSFDLNSGGLGIPTEMTLRARRTGRNQYEYTGTMEITLPEAENLEVVAEVLAQQLGKTTVRAKGNQLFIPVGMQVDHRFRSKSSNIVSNTTFYEPHDCFAVLGTCRYTAMEQDGSVASFIAETTESSGVWRTETKLDPSAENAGIDDERRRLVYSIDRNAVLIDMVIIQGSGPRQSRFEIRRK